jgi:hypothetical protein
MCSHQEFSPSKSSQVGRLCHSDSVHPEEISGPSPLKWAVDTALSSRPSAYYLTDSGNFFCLFVLGEYDILPLVKLAFPFLCVFLARPRTILDNGLQLAIGHV